MPGDSLQRVYNAYAYTDCQLIPSYRGGSRVGHLGGPPPPYRMTFFLKNTLIVQISQFSDINILLPGLVGLGFGGWGMGGGGGGAIAPCAPLDPPLVPSYNGLYISALNTLHI